MYYLVNLLQAQRSAHWNAISQDLARLFRIRSSRSDRPLAFDDVAAFRDDDNWYNFSLRSCFNCLIFILAKYAYSVFDAGLIGSVGSAG